MRARFAAFAFAAASLAGILAGGCAPTTVGGRASDNPVDSIVSLSPSTTEIVGTHARFDFLTGRTGDCNFPMTLQNVPIVADVKPNYEQIAQIAPDLIVYDDALFNEADVAKIQELGVETMVMDAMTVTEYIDWLVRFGARVGGETNVSDYVDRLMAAKSRAAGAPVTPTPKVAILMGDTPADLMIAGSQTFQADVVRSSGGEPVGPDADRYVPLNVEQLIALAPTAILTTGDAQAVLRDGRLASLPAVRTGRVGQVEPDVMLRRGARVDTLVSQIHRFLAAPGPRAAR